MPERLEVIVLMGLQGAGKSTLYARRFAATHALVSLDLYRSARNKRARQARELDAALAEGRSVVVDNTSPRLADRAAIIERARAFGARVEGWWVATELVTCLARNALRAGRAHVPVRALLATACSFVEPRVGEGFDCVRVVRDGSVVRTIEACDAGRGAW